MFTSRHYTFFSLLFALLLSLILPLWVGAEEPMPTAPFISKDDPHHLTEDDPTKSVSTTLSAPLPPDGCAPNQSTLDTAPNLPILDNQTITSTITVSGLNPYLWDVDLTTHIQHTFPGDLEVFLISPEGTEVTITTDNGNGQDNVFNGTRWDDQWVGLPVADYTYNNNTVVPTMSPEEAMGAFIGENPNGDWQLVIHDDATQDGGTLVDWALHLTTFPYEPDSINYSEAFVYPNIAIPDNGTLIQTQDFPAEPIHELGLSVDIEHANNADLDVWLVSPTGITVTLTTDNGGNLSGGFRYAAWGDNAGYLNPPGAVTDVFYEDGQSEDYLVPENALSAFNGTDGGGTWTLIVKDDTAGNTGTLNLWGIKNRTYSCIADLSVYQAGYFDVELNEPVPYTIQVRNTGSNLAANVLLTDTIPVGTTFLSWTPAPGWVCDTPPVGSTGMITCSGPTMLPDSWYTHTLQLMPIDAPQPLHENQVVVSTTSPDISPYNNYSEKFYRVRYRSANTNYWDVLDDLDFQYPFQNDSGSIKTGGQNALSGWGSLQIRVLDADNNILTDNQLIEDLDLAFTGSGWVSNNTPSSSGVAIHRTLFAPQAENYLRYLDTFTNNSNDVRQVYTAWGGGLGSSDKTTLGATSSGDLALTAEDQWAVTFRSDTFNPNGPAESPPVGYVLRGSDDTSYVGPSDLFVNPFENSWLGNGNYRLGHVFAFTLQPGETKHLLYFLYRGLQEERAAPDYCMTNCYTPAAGSEIALAQVVLPELAESPDFCDLPEEILDSVVNWPNASAYCVTAVFLPFITR